jgi:hypothetical protein
LLLPLFLILCALWLRRRRMNDAHSDQTKEV